MLCEEERRGVVVVCAVSVARKRVLSAQRARAAQHAQAQCERALQRRLRAGRLRSEWHAQKERVRMLRACAEEARRRITEAAAQQLQPLREANSRCACRLRGCAAALEAMARHVTRVRCEAQAQREAVRCAQLQLNALARTRALQLERYIFPIAAPHVSDCRDSTTVWTQGSPVAASGTDISALSDALTEISANTPCASGLSLPNLSSGVGDTGAWPLSGDSASSKPLSIVAPVLPSSGDVRSAKAALAFVAQIVNGLALFLDVQLPNKLTYRDFCSQELNGQQLAKRVSRLNSNVLWLCFARNVERALLHPAHTLHNVLHLLEADGGEGRDAAMEVEELLLRHLEEQLERDLQRLDEEDSISTESEELLGAEWEVVDCDLIG